MVLYKWGALQCPFIYWIIWKTLYWSHCQILDLPMSVATSWFWWYFSDYLYCSNYMYHEKQCTRHNFDSSRKVSADVPLTFLETMLKTMMLTFCFSNDFDICLSLTPVTSKLTLIQLFVTLHCQKSAGMVALVPWVVLLMFLMMSV